MSTKKANTKSKPKEEVTKISPAVKDSIAAKKSTDPTEKSTNIPTEQPLPEQEDAQDAPENTTNEPDNETVPASKETAKKVKDNVAIVKRDRQEIRRYTLAIHGKDFKKLAQEFADQKGYTVETDSISEGITCPNCGRVIPN